MNFGIIGFGRIARKFVQAIEATDEGKIYAIGSRSVFMDDPYLKEHSEVKVYKDYEELLNDPQVDAVYIALTHKFHKEWILRSLEHHVPVLSEKPLVLTATDVDEIQEKVKNPKSSNTDGIIISFWIFGKVSVTRDESVLTRCGKTKLSNISNNVTRQNSWAS